MRARSVTANSALALAADAASKGGALAVTVLSARLLPLEEFSTLVAALAVSGLLVSALDLGASTLLTRDGAGDAATRGMLLRRLTATRLPLVVLALGGATVAAALSTRPFVPLATVALALAGTAGLMLSAAFRAAQNLAPEAAQRLGAAILSIVAVAVCGLAVPRADAVVAALAAAGTLSLVPLATRVPSVVASPAKPLRPGVFRRALPLGLLTLATIAYYRSGILALAAVGDKRATAAFGIAATVAFGLLAVPNAITTALLPRLSALPGTRDVARTTRTALGATLAITVPLAGAAAAAGPWLLRLGFGARYAEAGTPFALLCAGLPVIAAAGVLGTALLALHRLRALASQVALSLAVNVGALAVLAPRLGASGASLATLTCEVVGLLVLLRTTRHVLPGAIALRRPLNRRAELAEAAWRST